MNRLRSEALVPWLVLLILVIGLSAALFAVESTQRRAVRVQTGILARQTAIRLEEHLQTRLSLVDGLRREWLLGRFTDRGAFEDRATVIQNTFPGYQAINWIDHTGVIRWVVPRQGNEPAEGSDLHTHPTAGETFKEAERTGDVRITPPVDLLQGGRGIASYFPITRDGVREGYLNGVFRIDRLVEDCLSSGLLDTYSIRLVDGDSAVYRSGNADADALGPFRARADITVGNRSWMLDVWPSSPILSSSWFNGERFLFAIGLLLSAGLAWIIRVALIRHTRLRATERQRLLLGELVEAGQDFIAVIDLEGRYTYLNRSGRELVGVPPEQEISQFLVSDLHDSSEAGQIREIVEGLNRGESWQGRLKLKHRETGELVPVEFRAFPIHHPDSHEVEFLASIGRDVRARESLEFQLRHAQKMEAIGRLAGGLAHDFNNLLTAVSGYAEIALRHDGLDPGVLRALEEISKAAHSGARLSAQLLTFSRKQATELSVFDLNDLLTGMEGMLRRLLREDIELVTLYDRAAPCPVRCDTGQMEQVVINLVVNASDAMPEGGRLTLTTSIEAADRDWALLRVSDTGTGIAAEVREKIFDPFFTTKEIGKGTGLGLAIVYGAIHSFEGTIQVTSAPGRGTTFEIRLPITDRPITEPSDRPPAEVDEERHGTILLVEDEEAVRNVAREMLESAGFHVVVADNGHVALDIVRDPKGETIDVVLTDIVMPEMGGRELAAELGIDHPHLPIVFTSGYDAESAARDSDSGAEELYLRKPYRSRDLIRMVGTAMAHASEKK